jgi:hypothetical protein
MTTIDLDAANWKTPSDFYDALCSALKAPEWHGRSVNAFIDSIIWHDNINGVLPPYSIRIRGIDSAPKAVRTEVEMLQQDLILARAKHRDMHGRDVDVQLETVT